ncbi:cell proliferation protein CDC123 [Mycosarcoma maydis]|uniref:Uncharacterized protein n=1 Tax=Mycosarcoma maydis TaxID=5270 RepID=A0A0D1CIK0_MYCMD|nr:cell proliferation protein CDC123 [Ustilago maydis 521]KIS66803.1 hypothetical protein UMAG_12285 [Ustilago maydis 521]|eukprot:XP_011391781.1 hypothetical protein UMAG_12285 [Ustilago maydis 521]
MSDAEVDNGVESADPLTPPNSALYWTSYGTWYPIFRKHAPKSTVIDIGTVQPELIHWLDSDTFILPEGSGPGTSSAQICSSSCSSSSCSSSAQAESEEDAQIKEAIQLSALDAEIRRVVSNYDGAVFPKLNWSAPLDSGFMLPGNNLQCLHPEDVYLLLKSSEFVGRDLEQISHMTAPCSGASDVQGAQSVGPQLVLKKWFGLNKSYEFRCFVRSHSLIAITQRDVTFFDHLQSRTLQSQIKNAICTFWTDVLLAAKQHAKWQLADYAFDVYLTKDLGRVWLVDINAWLPRTDPLLFDFQELDALHRADKARKTTLPSATLVHEQQQTLQTAQNLPFTRSNHAAGQDRFQHVEFRILSDRRLQSCGGTGATYSSNMVPKDLVDFAKGSTATNAAKDMSVEQIVEWWNNQVDSQDPPEH